MDPIHPIAPGPPLIATRLPVEPLERISRERDRPSKDSQRRRRREPPPSHEHEHDGEDDERPHIDVHA
jgi:hypothetical protein